MKKKNVYAMAVVILILLFSHTTAADDLDDQDSFKCHQGIVAGGDTEYQVLKKCGKPTAKTDYETVWVYDRGPSYFIYYIKFNSGRVLHIQSGKYGK